MDEEGDCEREATFRLTSSEKTKFSQSLSGMPWETKSRVFVILFSIMVLALGMSIIAVYLYHRELEVLSIEICLDCSLIRDHPAMKDQYEMVVSGEQCCFNSYNCKQLMVSLLADMLQSSRMATTVPIIPQALRSGKIGNHIGAHKHLQFTPDKNRKGDLPSFSRTMRTMSIDSVKDDYTEYSYEVTLHNDRIEVVHPGLYYVYLSIYFLPDSPHPCQDFETQTFTGTLLRRNPNRQNPDSLLKISHTCCPTCVHERESGYVGGVFFLQAGELLQVNVTTYDIVYVTRDITFMGLSMLNSNVQNSTNSTQQTPVHSTNKGE